MKVNSYIHVPHALTKIYYVAYGKTVASYLLVAIVVKHVLIFILPHHSHPYTTVGYTELGLIAY